MCILGLVQTMLLCIAYEVMEGGGTLWILDQFAGCTSVGAQGGYRGTMRAN